MLQSNLEMKSEEMLQRKKLFFKSIKDKNWRFLAAISLIGAVFVAYYINIFSYHLSEFQKVRNLNSQFPILIQRFEHIMLAYAFIRERVINNNSLSTFEPDFDKVYLFDKSEQDNNDRYSPRDIDQYYKELALQTESKVNDLKIS